MRANALPAFQAFFVEVSFFSGNDLYASETYTIDAVNWYRAEQAALEISTASAFDNCRVPELRREAAARPC